MADGDGERDEKKPRGAAANKNGSRRMEIEEWAPRLWLERRVRAANEEAREGKDVSSGYRREERHLLCDFAFCPGRLLKPIRREYELTFTKKNVELLFLLLCLKVKTKALALAFT